MLYIGIDPGLGGGIAILDEKGRVEFVVKMPATPRDLLDVFTTAMPASIVLDVVHGQRRALVERVHTMPRMGVVSAFTFGKGVGAIEMALTAARIPFDYVNPEKWQRAMGCLTKGDKNISKRRAQALFPGMSTITHAIADALLIAEHCRRMNRVNDGEEESGAQGHTEAPGRDRPQTQRVENERQRQARETNSRPQPAVAAAPRHGAGARRKAGQHLRGH